MSPSVGMRFGRYELLSRLGAGGMGEVFRARDHDLHREVAVKFLPERFAADPVRLGRFAQEARAASSLNHPNIVTIHEIGETSGLPYIVMELVEGKTLREVVLESRLSARKVLDLASQLADGLAKAHAVEIVHRDLKPENVMVTGDGFVKILDFGLAKLRADPDDDRDIWFDSEVPTWPDRPGSPKTATGVVLGTVGYMSPEQARGRPVDFRSDQFSFGAIVYEMVTRKQAFHRDSPPQTLTAIIEDAPESLADLSPSFPAPARWIVERCLEKAPADRYDSTADMARELRNVRARLPEGDSSGAPFRTTAPMVPLSRRRALTAVVSVAAVLAVLWGGREVLRRGGAALPGLQETPVVAVMPLTNLTGEESHDATAAGIAEVVVGSLSAIEGVQVLSRSSTAQYRDRKDDLPGVARELDATYLLDGVLQQSRNDLRVSLSLIQIPSNVVRWSGSFDGAFPRLFELQSRLALEVAHALRLSLSPRGRARIEARPTASPTAWDDYTAALALMDRRDREGHLARAVTHLEAALEGDPRFARAHALLGNALWGLYEETGDPALAERARDAVQEALRHDPDDAAVRQALAWIYSRRGRTSEAIEEARRARALSPQDDGPMRVLATILADDGQHQAALAEARLAVGRRPDFGQNQEVLGWVHYRAGRWAEAAAAYQRLTELQPDNAWAFLMLGATRHLAGDLDGAAVAYEDAIRLAPDARAWANLGYVRYARGRLPGALEAYDEAVRLAPLEATIRRSRGDVRAEAGDTEGSRQDWRKAVALSLAALETNPRNVDELGNLAVCRAKLGERDAALASAREVLEAGPASADAHHMAAVAHALLDDAPRALELLERALELGASVSEAAADNDLAALRDLPRYRALIERFETNHQKEEGNAT